MKCLTRLLITCLFLSSCHPRTEVLDPNICYIASEATVKSLPPPPFPPLTESEKRCEWAKELYFGNQFAREFDLYRAITSYKRAYLLLPKKKYARRQQVQFLIAKSYFLGAKYQEVTDTFEGSELFDVDSNFPLYRELLLMLYESYGKTCKLKQQEAILNLIECIDPCEAQTLRLGNAVEEGEISCLYPLSENLPAHEPVLSFRNCFCQNRLSPTTAQTLNAVLPGAGYLYVGQKKTALTSLLINSAFIATTWYFIEEENWGAAFISGSLELGWYFGGINGAGLAAKEYNEQLYNKTAYPLMCRERLFPILRFQTSF